ncbi:glycosyltransferase family 39 protein [bacterium]|nr:glycosyltransferase family 39 protein [candidate division CSSED10-310 bacterium]
MKTRKWIPNTLFFAGILLLRASRIAAPDVQIEDPNYIYGAFLIMKGMLPFAEFAQVNPPLLEFILAVLYRIFGVSHRIPEGMSALAFILSAVLIRRLGDRLADSRSAGMIAAYLYSIHYLLFRYHVFERETYATLGVLVAIELLTRTGQTRWTPVVAGLVTGFAFACKQTAVVPCAGIVSFLVIFQQDFRSAIRFAAGFTFFVILITAGYSAAFGSLYIEQTFWFHWIKGYVAPWYIKAAWTTSGLGYLVPLTIGSAWFFRKSKTNWHWLCVILILLDLAFFWFVSGAFWPHYLLSTLPFCALLSGRTLAEVIGAHSAVSRATACASLVSIAVLIGLMQIIQPGAVWGTGVADRYGFAGTPRQAVREAATAIQLHTQETDLIISDPFIALESQRIKVVRFKDNWGLILWMKRMMDAGEYRVAVKKLSGQRFGDVRKRSQMYWMPLIETAFSEGSVGAVQPNYELPLDASHLSSHGMKIVLQNEFYTIWVRK